MNRKQKLNRIIGFLLAVVLAAGLLPFSLLPAEAEPSGVCNMIDSIREEDFEAPDEEKSSSPVPVNTEAGAADRHDGDWNVVHFGKGTPGVLNSSPSDRGRR